MHIAHPFSQKCTPSKKKCTPPHPICTPPGRKCAQQRPFVKMYKLNGSVVADDQRPQSLNSNYLS